MASGRSCRRLPGLHQLLRRSPCRGLAGGCQTASQHPLGYVISRPAPQVTHIGTESSHWFGPCWQCTCRQSGKSLQTTCCCLQRTDHFDECMLPAPHTVTHRSCFNAHILCLEMDTDAPCASTSACLTHVLMQGRKTHGKKSSGAANCSIIPQ